MGGLIPPTVRQREDRPELLDAGIPGSAIGDDQLSKGLVNGLKKENYRPDDAKFVPTGK